MEGVIMKTKVVWTTRLIAAAPKLLTALIELVRISTPPASPVQDLAVQAALAAIAEARGES